MYNMSEIIDILAAIFKQSGVQVFGMAGSAHFENEKAGRRPGDMLPGASTSLICFGIAIPKGLFQNRKRLNDNYSRIASIYYQRLDQISSRIAVSLESEGHTALPILS